MHPLYRILLACLLLTVVGCRPDGATRIAGERAATHQRDSIDYVRQQRTVTYTDSLLQVLMPQSDSLLRHFVYHKDEQYEDHGHYVHRTLYQQRHNTARCYLYAYVDDNGTPFVVSRYTGAPIAHNTVFVTIDSLSATFSGELYSFREEDGTHETLTLSGEEALQLLRLVDNYADCRIGITLRGKNNYRYYLTNSDKQALAATGHLTTLMRDIQLAEQQRRQASLQVEKYQKRLQKQ